jgi:hypothetical protein
LIGFRPGKSQACGRAARHHSRNSSSGIVNLSERRAEERRFF